MQALNTQYGGTDVYIVTWFLISLTEVNTGYYMYLAR